MQLMYDMSITWQSRFYVDQRAWDYMELNTDEQLTCDFLTFATLDSSLVPDESFKDVVARDAGG